VFPGYPGQLPVYPTYPVQLPSYPVYPAQLPTPVPPAAPDNSLPEDQPEVQPL